MSLDYYFYVESRADGVWDVPAAFTPPDAPHHRQVEEFAWLPGNDGADGLFFFEGALIPFRDEHPPAWETSALYRWRRPDLWAGEPGAPVIRWIPYAELMVDLWDETRVVVKGIVPAPFAAHFGDGSRPFPEAALRAAGLDEHGFWLLRRSWPADAPIDRTFGQARHEIEAGHPHHPLEVTWVETVSSYLGREKADAFRSLRRFGADADLRVICDYS